jgi:TonB family protein
MPDDRGQDEDGGFKKTFVAIAIVHLVLLGGLLLATLFQSKASNDNVVWMTPGAFGGGSAATQSPVTSGQEPASPPHEEPNQLAPPEMDQREEPAPSPPEATPPFSTPPPEVEGAELPISTATPTPTPAPTLTPTPHPNPTPTAKPTPKPTPKPAPRPSPARSATPRSSPKPEVSPKEKEKDKPKTDSPPKPKTSPGKSESKEKPSSSPSSGAQQAQESESKGKPTHDQMSGGLGSRPRSVSGNGRDNGQAAGAGDSALSAYVGILTNRFQAAWNQPTSEMALGKTLQVTVKLKVESDGTVTEFNIIEGSGNAVVDDSVREAGKKIAKLPPPPNGQAFSAPVHFELGN